MGLMSPIRLMDPIGRMHRHIVSARILSIPSRKLGIAGSQPSPRSFAFDTLLLVQARFRVKLRGPNSGIGLPVR